MSGRLNWERASKRDLANATGAYRNRMAYTPPSKRQKALIQELRGKAREGGQPMPATEGEARAEIRRLRDKIRAVQPATDKQLDYIRDLRMEIGLAHDLPMPFSVEEAGAEIKSLLSSRVIEGIAQPSAGPPTGRQIAYIKGLRRELLERVDRPIPKTKLEAGKEIDRLQEKKRRQPKADNARARRRKSREQKRPKK